MNVILLLGVAFTSAVAWFALDALPWPARAFTVLLAGPLPALALVQARALAELGPERLPRVPVYISSMISLWLLALLALAAASTSRFTPGLIGLRPLPTTTFLAWTIVGVGTAAILFVAGKLLRIRESDILIELLPQTLRERVVFAALSVTAGICEELVFRGFLIAALTFVTGSVLVAAIVSSVLFGLLHAYQSAVGVARAAVLGFALAMPMLFAGSILPGVAAHTAIDLIGGLWIGRRLNLDH